MRSDQSKKASLWELGACTPRAKAVITDKAFRVNFTGLERFVKLAEGLRLSPAASTAALRFRSAHLSLYNVKRSYYYHHDGSGPIFADRGLHRALEGSYPAALSFDCGARRRAQ